MGGSLDNEGGLTMETTLMGTGTVAEVLRHYSSHFTGAGWQQVDQIPSKTLGVATFEITAKGVQWYCVLIASTPTTSLAHVSLTLRRK